MTYLIIDFAKQNTKKSETEEQKDNTDSYLETGKVVKSYNSSKKKNPILEDKKLAYKQEELVYKQRRLDQAKAREERLQREDKRRPLDDTRKNISTVVNVSREGKGWVNTGHKIFGWFR